MAASAVIHDQIHNDLYNKVNSCTVAIGRLTVEIQTLKTAMRDETDRYVDMLHKAQDRMFKLAGSLFLCLVFCITIIGYGAIGKQGMYTVRDTVPTGGAPQVVPCPFIPPDNNHDIPTGSKK